MKERYAQEESRDSPACVRRIALFGVSLVVHTSCQT